MKKKPTNKKAIWSSLNTSFAIFALGVVVTGVPQVISHFRTNARAKKELTQKTQYLDYRLTLELTALSENLSHRDKEEEGNTAVLHNSLNQVDILSMLDAMGALISMNDQPDRDQIIEARKHLVELLASLSLREPYVYTDKKGLRGAHEKRITSTMPVGYATYADESIKHGSVIDLVPIQVWRIRDRGLLLMHLPHINLARWGTPFDAALDYFNNSDVWISDVVSGGNKAQSGRREVLTPAPHTTDHTDP